MKEHKHPSDCECPQCNVALSLAKSQFALNRRAATGGGDAPRVTDAQVRKAMAKRGGRNALADLETSAASEAPRDGWLSHVSPCPPKRRRPSKPSAPPAKPAHTPGPWQNNGGQIEAPSRNIAYRNCDVIATVGEVNNQSREDTANASLIAAAPETAAERDRLLEQLRAINREEHAARSRAITAEGQVKELLAACKLLRLAFEQAVPASEMQDWWRDGWNQSGRAIANATASAGQAEGRAQ